jgi:hypothetical protein
MGGNGSKFDSVLETSTTKGDAKNSDEEDQSDMEEFENRSDLTSAASRCQEGEVPNFSPYRFSWLNNDFASGPTFVLHKRRRITYYDKLFCLFGQWAR